MRGRRASVAVLIAAALVAAVAGAAVGSGGGPARSPARHARSAPGAALGTLPAGTLPTNPSVGGLAAAALGDLRRFSPTGRGVRVGLISSGVDLGALPAAARSQVTLLGNDGDPAGFGTYAASVVLQLESDARITSIGVYPDGRFSADWQQRAFDWTLAHAADLDVILYEVPPSAFLDPVSAAEAAGEWHAVTDGEQPALGHFRQLAARWSRVRSAIASLAAEGVGVVVPAGDLGPRPQTVLGIGNFPEVVTVGAADGDTPAATSGAGPSIDGKVKPDLLAPSGIVGVMPAQSALAAKLRTDGLLDPALQPAWAFGEVPSRARARLASSMSAAAVVAMSMGGMGAEHERNVTRQRGALLAASRPVSSAPVWRQGAGVLRRAPDAAFARARPMVLGHGDLGAEPSQGPWSTTVPVTGGAVAGADPHLDDFVGVDVDGEPVIGPARAGAASTPGPPVTASAGNQGLILSAPLGGDAARGGLYCGYTNVSLVGTSGTVDPTVDADGLPVATRSVPTCLVKGTRLDALGFYIHRLPAESLTFTLLPDVPIAGEVLRQPLHMVPIDPSDFPLFQAVTGPDGYAHLPNIPPGYFLVREWSDYGAPVSQTVAASRRGSPVTLASDIGENPGYQNFEALVISPLCSDTFDGLDERAGSPCTQQLLERRLGPDHVHYDKATGGYLVQENGRQVLVVSRFVKKMPGVSVSSRVIDLIDAGDLRYASAELGGGLDAAWLGRLMGAAGRAWQFRTSPADHSTLLGSFDPAAAVGHGTVLGVARYPLNLPTPNYSMHLSLNFSYDVTNALVVPIVVVGGGVAYGVVGPAGVIQGPTIGIDQPVGIGDLTVRGHAAGTANFDIHMKPQGTSTGMLYLVFVPPVPVAGAQAAVGNLSFEMDTWTNTMWPARTFPPTPLIDPVFYPAGQPKYTGHSFTVDPHYPGYEPSRFQQQIAGECRNVDNGRLAAKVCEDWVVMVHSPKENAAVYDVEDRSGRSELGRLRADWSGFFDPHRGIKDFSQRLAFIDDDVAGQTARARLSAPKALRTNGRFWEQLVLGRRLFQEFPGEVRVLIQDYKPGSQSTYADHRPGPVPVAPYVPYAAQATLRVDPLLSHGDLDRLGIGGLRLPELVPFG